MSKPNGKKKVVQVVRRDVPQAVKKVVVQTTTKTEQRKAVAYIRHS